MANKRLLLLGAGHAHLLLTERLGRRGNGLKAGTPNRVPTLGVFRYWLEVV